MEPASFHKVVFRRLAFYSVVAGFLLSAASGAEPPPKIEAHRLGRSEILHWLQASFGTGRPIEFRSHDGRGCCDMGDTSLVFRPDRTIYILRDGYVGTEFTLPYRILADGKITVEPTDNKLQADYLLSEDIHDFYVFRYGSSVYLVQESNVRPDFAVPGGLHWPLKFMQSTDATH
jgi:hypothetical protein